MTDGLWIVLRHKLAACSDTELASLRKIFVSMRDGMSKREDWFGEGVTEKASISLDQLKPGTPDAPKTPAPGGAAEAEKKKAEAAEADQKQKQKRKAASTPPAEPDEPGAHDGDLEL
jgi:hypothetical protein